MKMMKRILLALTAVAMMVTLLTTSAFALGTRSGKSYKTYTCFGDSVAAGYSLDKYDYTHDYSKFEWKTTPNSYPDLVKKGVGAEKIYQFAHSAYRTTDLRVLLDRNFTGDRMAGYRLPSVNNDERNIDWEAVARYRDYVEKAVKASDLITIGIGINDASMPLLNATETMTDSMTAAMTLDLGRVVKDVTFYGALAEGELNAFRLFSQNFDAIIQCIHNYNKKAKIIVVGDYNPAANYLGGLGSIVGPIFANQNNYMQNQSPMRDYYTFIDISDIKTHMNDPESPMYGADFHPTVNGHRDTAKKILAAL